MTDDGTSRDRILRHLGELLEIDRFRDACPNGLQVEGAKRVRSVVTGVSACRELIEHAAAAGADALLVHHGLFWEGDSRRVTGFRKDRLQALLAAELNLLAYHLPLDAHATLGNNALGLGALGASADELQPFANFGGADIGHFGRFPEPISPDELLARCRAAFGGSPLTFSGGPAAISTVGMVSGGGSKAIYEAIELGLDAFITGEPTEWVMNVALEAGIHFVAAGHHRTEVLGIRALGDYLADRYSLEVAFVDVPNPI